MTTIHDVAKHAGVSATTAKRAIREPQKLNKSTLERVQDAIRALNYEPDRTAGALRRGHSHTIGLLVGNLIEPFFAQLTRSIAKASRAHGYALLVADNEYNTELEQEQLRLFHGHRVSGLIVRPAFGQGNLDYLKTLHAQGTYILEIDHTLQGSPFSHVLLNNKTCVQQGVQYLFGLGHRRIAGLTTYDANSLQDERGQAFPQALQSLGLTLPSDYQQLEDLSEEAGYRRTIQLMRLKQPPTAIFSMTGNEAAGAFRALRQLGLRIPHDVSLLSFDDYSWTSLVDPPLDVIAQPIEEMGLLAAEITLNAIRQRQLQHVEHRRLHGTLIKRGSCAPPANA